MIDLRYTEDGGVLVTAEGTLTGRELIASKDTLYASEEKIRSIAYQLADFRKVTEVSFSSTTVRCIAEKDKQAAQVNPDMVIAVVGGDDLHYGLSRMWEEYCGESAVRAMICRSMAEARQWIRDQLTPENDAAL